MTTDTSKDLTTVLEGMRDESPELRAELDRRKPRRELADSLVQMRVRAGLTQKALAQQIERDQAFVSRLESTAGPVPDAATIALYADACGYASGYLFAQRPAAAYDPPDEVVQIVNLNNVEQDEDILVHALGEPHHLIAGE